MSQLYLAQPADQQQLEWLDNGTLAMLLDGAATDGQLMMGRFAVARGEAPPYHEHLHEDEIFMLIKGTALVWYDEHQYELQEGGVVFLPRNVPHGYRVTSERADLLMINTPAGIEACSARRAGTNPSPASRTSRCAPTPRPPNATATSSSARRAETGVYKGRRASNGRANCVRTPREKSTESGGRSLIPGRPQRPTSVSSRCSSSALCSGQVWCSLGT